MNVGSLEKRQRKRAVVELDAFISLLTHLSSPTVVAKVTVRTTAQSAARRR